MTMTAGSIFDFDETIDPGAITSDADMIALANGGFVIVGQSAGGVDGVIYSSTGKAIASFDDQPGKNASVVQLADGRLAVVTEDSGTTFVRYYDSKTGVGEVGSRGSFTNPAAVNIDAAATKEGNLVVSYQMDFPSDSDIQFDIWNASGTRVETVLVDSSAADDDNASITVLDNGNVALAWTRPDGKGETAILYAVYESDGDVVTGPTVLWDAGVVARNPSIVAVDGGFAVACETDGQFTGSIDIFVREVDFNGSFQGSVFVTNLGFNQSGEGDGTQNSDAYLARSPDGNLAVTYTRDLNGNKDQVVTVLRDMQVVSGAQPEIDFPNLDNPQIDPIVTFLGPGKLAALHTDTKLGEVRGDIIHGFRDAFGDEDDDFFQGDDFVDLLNGLGGSDTLNGGNNNDELLGGDGSDTLHGNNGDDSLSGDGNGGDADLGDKLFGDAGNDQLFGEAGDDTLDGGTGDDKMFGGSGNDIYYVDSLKDQVSEFAGDGTADVVAARSTYSIGTGVDVEILRTTSSAGTTKIDLTGSALKQTITGNAGDNVLSSGGGAADTMQGLGGNDIFRVYNSGEIVVESANAAGGTADRVSAAVDYVLKAGIGIEILTTNSSTGTSGIDLTGNAFAQSITGNDGANILNDGGAGGADTMAGRGGNDIYIVNNSGDAIAEGATQGAADQVSASVDYVLKAGVFVELMTTTNSKGVNGIDLTGNAFAQSTTGNDGDNILNDGGLGGADTMAGRGGNDIYRINNSGDVIIESASAAGGTADRVSTSVDYRLADGVGIEIMTTSNSKAVSAVDLTGNAFAQSLTGNAGDNRLEGREGNDTLQGGAGKDTFVFNTAPAANSVDTIGDFNVVDDRFLLSDAMFKALSPGILAFAAFRANTTGLAADATDRIVYESDTGKLFYDADGLGGATGIQFAKLAVGLALTNTDFSVA
ncbi:calcium-binding protein [Mesorhizobium sp. IMUNJ 23232]|uniref:calcium-binding protein n=1 Tax=Mesorhizobium sp. IMUNJ 23232 TaxID=3376064 RepID=UPI00379D14DF